MPGISGMELTVDEHGLLTRETLDRLAAEVPCLDLQDWETRPFTRPLDLITIGCLTELARTALEKSEEGKEIVHSPGR